MNLLYNIMRATITLTVGGLLYIGTIQDASAATTFYVSSSNGSDTNDGRSAEKAWQHLSKIYLKSISAEPFQPGDNILLKCGDHWDGQIRLRANGTSDAPITIGAYGQGTKPLLSGEPQHVQWKQVLSHPGIYTIDLGAGGILGAIVQDGKTLRAIYPTGPLKREQDIQIFFSKLQPGTLAGQLNGRVWIRLADSESPNGRVRIFGYAGVSLSTSSYVRIENLDIERFSAGMDIENSQNVIIQHNDIRNVLGLGIYLRGGDSDCRVESNTVSHSGNTALYVLKGMRNVFRDNWVSHVDNSVLDIPTSGDHMGIGLQESHETLVEHNYFTFSGGIDFYYEQDSTVRYNYLSRVSSAGAPHGVNLKIYGNIYDLAGEQERPASTGLNAVATGPGTIAVYNNTIFDASKFFLMGSASKGGKVVFSDNIAVSATGAAMLAVYGPDVMSNHNCFFTAGEPTFTYAKKTFHDLATYREASGLEKDSVIADPQFVSGVPVTPLNFRIAAGSGCNSPAIDIPGAERARTYDHDLSIANKPVIGAFRIDAAKTSEFRQLCSKNCLGRRFEVPDEIYLVRVKMVAGVSKPEQISLILNGTRVVAEAMPQIASNTDLSRYFLVRPGRDSIVIEADVGMNTSAVAEVSILPFDTSHGEGVQVISW